MKVEVNNSQHNLAEESRKYRLLCRLQFILLIVIIIAPALGHTKEIYLTIRSNSSFIDYDCLRTTNRSRIIDTSITSKTYSGLLTNYRANINSGLTNKTDSVQDVIKFSMVNLPVFAMISQVYLKLPQVSLPPNRILLNVENPVNYAFTGSKDSFQLWLEKNGRCYQSILPSNLSERDRQRHYQMDLSDFLNLKIELNEIEYPCWVLKRSQNFNELWKNAKRKEQLTDSDMVLRPMTLYTVLGRMNYNEKAIPPTFDETGLSDQDAHEYFLTNIFTERVQWPLEYYYSDMELQERTFNRLATAMLPYGINLVKEVRNVKMLVIKDR